MRARIVDNNWIYVDNLTQAEENVLWNAFSVSRDNVYIDPDSFGSWDGVYRKFNRAKGRLARPFLGLLRAVAAHHNLPLVVVDERPPAPYNPILPEDIGPDFLKGVTLDDDQIVAIRKSCTAECGLYNFPTGSGKSLLLAGICKAHDCPTVILADQTVVVEQLKARIELHDITDRVGVFYAGQRPSGETVVVGSIQSLCAPTKPPSKPTRELGESDAAWARREKLYASQFKAFHTRLKNAKSLQEYVRRAELLLVDEVDKCSSNQWKNLFRHWYKGRRRFGFSGTPYDAAKPVENMEVQEHMGSIIAQESRQNLLAKGRIIDAEYISIAVGESGNPSEKSTFDIAMDEHLVSNAQFHQLVVALAKRHVNESTLILVDRVALGDTLYDRLTAAGITNRFIHGGTQKRQRREALRAFERRDFRVLIGGKIINRGLDLAGGCDNLIIATGGKQWSDLMQKVGRALRKNERGRSVIYDFYFRCNHYLYSHSRQRLKAMVDAGYKTTVVCRDGKIDGAELIRRRWRLPKPGAAAAGQGRLF